MRIRHREAAKRLAAAIQDQPLDCHVAQNAPRSIYIENQQNFLSF
jgi:hypothetical protein